MSEVLTLNSEGLTITAAEVIWLTLDHQVKTLRVKRGRASVPTRDEATELLKHLAIRVYGEGRPFLCDVLQLPPAKCKRMKLEDFIFRFEHLKNPTSVYGVALALGTALKRDVLEGRRDLKRGGWLH